MRGRLSLCRLACFGVLGCAIMALSGCSSAERVPLIAPSVATTPAAPRLRPKWLAACALAAVAVGWAAWAQLHGRAGSSTAGFTVVAVYPHDPNAFTQGLAIANGQLYEGTGLYGQSTIRKVDLAAGQSFTVDTGHIVAFDASLDYKVRKFGNWKSTFLGGEGLADQVRRISRPRG